MPSTRMINQRIRDIKRARQPHTITHQRTRYAQLRSHLGFTQAEMASLLETTQQSVANYELGHRTPPVYVQGAYYAAALAQELPWADELRAV